MSYQMIRKTHINVNRHFKSSLPALESTLRGSVSPFHRFQLFVLRSVSAASWALTVRPPDLDFEQKHVVIVSSGSGPSLSLPCECFCSTPAYPDVHTSTKALSWCSAESLFFQHTSSSIPPPLLLSPSTCTSLTHSFSRQSNKSHNHEQVTRNYLDTALMQLAIKNCWLQLVEWTEGGDRFFSNWKHLFTVCVHLAWERMIYFVYTRACECFLSDRLTK